MEWLNETSARRLSYGMLCITLLVVLWNIVPDGLADGWPDRLAGWWGFWQSNHEGVRSLAFSLAGLLGVFGLWLAYRRTKAADRQATAALDNSKAALQQATLAGARLDTDRFSKATEQLGHKKMAVRLGAIYALEQVAKDSAKEYHWPIMETLTAFVRQGDPGPVIAYHDAIIVPPQDDDGEEGESIEAQKPDLPPISADISAAVAVLARREAINDPDGRFLDLSGANLTGLSLANVEPRNLAKARLSSTRLEGARLFEAHLEGAHLRGAHLEDADLGEAILTGADLRMTDVSAEELAHAINPLSAKLDHNVRTELEALLAVEGDDTN